MLVATKCQEIKLIMKEQGVPANKLNLINLFHAQNMNTIKLPKKSFLGIHVC